ncbi:isoprenoid biosynthesis glyoxalase ElbB [Dickeya dadantii]|uniref:Glyoxalase n=1 Tax=Dickeya dadantii (strain 3937) TaxID=198628 RepID=E0SHF3_DICD3|nr:isoprenoid biosynthesis glyoxalase ElbB [Dickeya dadantii]ADM96552.1 isoprenoid biosynthesis protein with amidotransferase-like domain [Dickeya dadantii 3937]MCL6405316.1 isoprenoid biosynthesis glyoxalase ElbB [Dickeya dadantii]NAT76424.1 isoprenoid biosynthesis protein ElbB [Dickeya dadantii]NPE51555.1 isoprenoid biosynthesis glyoxalase ElbB [Dickeya dadantii]NPE55296.1 isoprenoid biosynthesis glyoxalase ElbB [Dickeya dadantii]
MKKVGVVLSGCGVYDGSEIHEVVLTLLAIDRAGAEAVCFAPDKQQLHVINHLTGEVTGEKRNVLAESARIARGKIQPLSSADPQQLDALIVPGGFGAAKNLSDFATRGADCEIDNELKILTREIHKKNKPIGFICIAPAMLPKLLDTSVQLTIGNDEGTAQAIEAMGGVHVTCPVDDIVVDVAHKVVTTPAYMLANSIGEAASGIEKLVTRVLELAE